MGRHPASDALCRLRARGGAWHGARMTRTLSVTFAIVFACAASTAGQSWKDKLKDGLEALYPVTKRSMMDTNRITKQGTVLVVKKEGIAADLGSDLRYSITYVEGGGMREQGGATLALTGGKDRSRTFRNGERVYVTDVKVGDDHVMLMILSVDMSDYTEKGNTKQTRYKGAVSFKIPKSEIQAMTPDAVKALIDPVLAIEAEAASAPPPTIALGQSFDEVQKILGKPDQVINLGSKVTYVYKSMKVIFMDGKVADVQ
jgi:hypothetical protein